MIAVPAWCGWRWLVGVVLGAVLVGLPWLLDPYLITVASYALIAIVVALSAQLLNGLAGFASLGQAAYLGVGAYAAAICARGLTVSGPVQLFAAVGAAGLVAAIVGVGVTRTRGLAFMLGTLAFAELLRIAVENTVVLTGGGNGLATPPVEALPGLGPLTWDGHIYLYDLVIAAGVVAVMVGVRRSRSGVIVRGIADHEPRMRANGHPTHHYLWGTYVIAAAIAGGAGAMLIATRRYVSPIDVGFEVSALALLAAIMGGRSVLATCVAAAAIVAIRDLAGNTLPGYTPTLLGVLFLVVALARAGTLSLPGGARLWGRT